MPASYLGAERRPSISSRGYRRSPSIDGAPQRRSRSPGGRWDRVACLAGRASGAGQRPDRYFSPISRSVGWPTDSVEGHTSVGACELRRKLKFTQPARWWVVDDPVRCFTAAMVWRSPRLPCCIGWTGALLLGDERFDQRRLLQNAVGLMVAQLRIDVGQDRLTRATDD